MRSLPTTLRALGEAEALRGLVAAVASAADEADALRVGLERAVEALGADAGAVLRGDAVAAATGWPDGVPPVARLASLAVAGEAVIDLPGAADAVIVAAPLADGHLIVVRAGERLTDADTALLHAMAAVLDGTAAMAGDLAGAQNARAAAEERAGDLQRRQRLFEDLSGIQRSISHRAPLPEVLDAVVAAAEDLFGDEMPALLLADEDDPGTLRVVASRGLSPVYRESLGCRRAGEGVAGRAYAEGRPVVIEDYSDSADAMPRFRSMGVTAAMAAPVHEHGRVIGSLIVSTHRPGRRYSETERDILTSLAEHASLAVSDAKTVAAVAHQAMHDVLTGLPNSALFRDRLTHAAARGRRFERPIAVLFCDLDRFKTVNDSVGHAGGDELLVAIGERLRQCVRASDTAARLGGDEFAVLLEDIDHPGRPHVVARRIVEALRQPLEIGGHVLRPGVSVGVAVGIADAGELLRWADLAMYRAKGEGAGRVAVYEPAMGDEAVDRLALEADLARAVENGELEVDYQPIVALGEQRLVGFEALVRWAHPERGRMAPGVFVPVAEETGLVRDIGRHVLRSACAQAARWRRQHPDAGLDTITVNLSGRELADPRLPSDVAGALRASGLPARCLVLEITETVLMRDTETTLERLAELKALGVRLAVDDFGTGYSSLRYLRRFPVDILKMAKPFIDTIATDDVDTALACTILDLGANLGLQVVAEGIERDEQATVLRELGCEMGQGYHYARPLSAEAASAMLGDPPRHGVWSVRAGDAARPL
jgi:diguanylate cyclase (GGDEF)-like protein